MDGVAHQSASDRAALFNETAAEKGISARIAEKDFWVCWALRHLFALHPTLLFKGGTSLSKCFRLIQRFSEDIDLTLSRAELGFAGPDDPLNLPRGNARRRQIENLKEACRTAVRDHLEPRFREVAARILGDDGWSIEIEERQDGQVNLHFHYPRALSVEGYGGGLSSLKPRVLMEIGATSDQDPSERVSIQPYAAEHFPSFFTEPETQVRVLAAERTFWEKATLLHAENYRPPEKRHPPNLSRHAYDLVMLDRGGIADNALGKLDLLEAVVCYKDVFFQSAWARYDLAKPGSFVLEPNEALSKTLRVDYGKMQEMLFGDRPSFDEIITVLRQLHEKINGG